MNFAPSACSAFISGVRAAASSAAWSSNHSSAMPSISTSVVGNVGARALACDVVLHVAAQAGHG